MKKQNIFLSITDGFAERMLLKTDFLKFLKDKCNVVVFIPDHGQQKKEFISEPLVKYQPSGLAGFLHWYVRGFMYENFKKNETLTIKLKNMKKTNLLKYLIIQTLLLLTRIKPIRKMILYLNYFLIPEFYKVFFEKYNPALVICSSGGIKADDLPLIKSAKKRKILTIGIIQSWDNLTSKGYINPKQDKFIVWNDIMKEELTLFHGVDEKDIFVSGPIHYDFFFSSVSKDDFIHKYNIPSYNKVILITSSPEWTYQHFEWIVENILKAIDEKKIRYPAKVILRLHPNDPPQRYEKIKNENLIINLPAIYEKNMGWIQEKEHIEDFISLLKFSDVVVCVSSTITIDAACFDTPVINIAFDRDNLQYELSCRRYYDYAHYKNIVKTGGVRISYNLQELIDYINLYLEDKNLDREGRKRIVLQQCKFIDGKSAERAAKYILSFME